MTHRGRKWLRILGVVVLGLAAAWFVAPYIIAPILRGQLESIVARHLNAELRMDSISYTFPYTLRARNAALVAKDAAGRNVDLFRVEELEFALAKIPVGSGPVVIERIIAGNPSMHLVLEPGGLAGFKQLVRAEPAVGGGKLSDHFQLRQLSIREGQVVYEDRRTRTDLPPLAWRKINVELGIEPRSGSQYNWELTARNAPLAVANVRGTADVDTALLGVEKFVLGVTARRGEPLEALPPAVQKTLKQFELDGTFALTGRASLPLNDLSRGTYEAQAILTAGSTRLSEWDGRLDHMLVKLSIANEPLDSTPGAATRPATSPASIKLDQIELVSGDTTLRLEKAIATIDPQRQMWRVGNLLCRLEIGADRKALPTAIQKLIENIELSGQVSATAAALGPLAPQPDRPWIDQIEYQLIAYPRDLSLKPAGFAQPITGAAGTIRANGQVIAMENVQAACGPDRFFIKAARIPLDNIKHEIQVQEITGSVELSGKMEGYPRPFDEILHHLRPAGVWNVTGNWARRLDPRRPAEFWFDINTDKGAFSAGDRRIPLTDIRCEISASPKAVEIRKFLANSLDGEVRIEGHIAPGKPLSYGGVLWVRNLDLKQLARLLAEEKQQPMRLSGKGNLNAKFGGAGPDEKKSALDNLVASGRFEVLEGDFWEVPVIRETVAGAKVARDALTVGQAGGSFAIANQTVTLRDSIIASPVFGLQGGGTVGFDGGLGLKVVAAPLADWKDQMKRTKIPIFSDLAGELLGGIQKLLNSASKTLLYEFRITGTTSAPRVTPVPTPILTEPLARLFDGMLKGKKIQELSPADDGKAPEPRKE